MTVWWCRGCGMEDTRSHDSCPSCGSALQEANIEWLDERDEGAETEFEIETTPDERAAIVDALMKENIRHRWEGPLSLVVADASGDAVDAILDEVLGEDEESDDDNDDEDGDDVDDEDEDEDEDEDIYLDADPYGTASDDGYEVISRLFIAAGKVLKKKDNDDIDDFVDTANEVLKAATPFGVDEETWADIQSAAKNTSVALAEDHKAPVDSDLKALHNLLQQFV